MNLEGAKRKLKHWVGEIIWNPNPCTRIPFKAWGIAWVFLAVKWLAGGRRGRRGGRRSSRFAVGKYAAKCSTMRPSHDCSESDLDEVWTGRSPSPARRGKTKKMPGVLEVGRGVWGVKDTGKRRREKKKKKQSSDPVRWGSGLSLGSHKRSARWMPNCSISSRLCSEGATQV